MKKLFLIAVLVAALAALFANPVSAAGPTAPVAPTNQTGTGFGYGSGRAMQAPGIGIGMRRGAPEWAGSNDNVAGILGLSVEQLQVERLAGKSLVEIAASKGIDEETLIAKLLEARKANVSELLSAGTITQAQADYMLSNMAEHVKIMVERTTVRRPAFAGQSPMAGAGRGRLNR